MRSGAISGGMYRYADSWSVLQAPTTDAAAVEEVVSRVEAVRIVVPQTQRTFIPALPKSLQEQVICSIIPKERLSRKQGHQRCENPAWCWLHVCSEKSRVWGERIGWAGG